MSIANFSFTYKDFKCRIRLKAVSPRDMDRFSYREITAAGRKVLDECEEKKRGDQAMAHTGGEYKMHMGRSGWPGVSVIVEGR